MFSKMLNFQVKNYILWESKMLKRSKTFLSIFTLLSSFALNSHIVNASVDRGTATIHIKTET